MKNLYSISIPKPCHEDWKQMTPKEKGRFCDSCAKTVIDFTKMEDYKIQDFINKNRNNRICGHFKQSQLDSINLHIPSQVLEQHQSFHKLFLLVLLIVMGTTLMNCTNKNGDRRKIDSVEVIDSINNTTIDILGGVPKINEIDLIPNKTCKSNSKKSPSLNITTDGELAIMPIAGSIEIIENPPIEIDSLNTLEPTDLVGIIIHEEENTAIKDEDLVFSFIQVETPQEFKNTPSNLSNKRKRDYFSEKISEIVSKNFNTSVCLDLKGQQKIQTQFKIDKRGNVIDIKARAPHPLLEKEAKRVIKLLPQFISAKQGGKPIKMIYNLPIIFQIEE